MAYLFAPRPSNDKLPVFFNVDGVVGAAPAQNNREDVLLVQFAFQLIGKTPQANTTPALLAASKAVKVTGQIDAQTIQAIAAIQQQNPPSIVDGRVSPAKMGYDYGTGVFTIVLLNRSVRNRHTDNWPRIDKIAGCPAELKEMVIRSVVGR